MYNTLVRTRIYEHREKPTRSLFVSDSPAKTSKNKTGTSKVGAISKAQKAQKTFFKKKLEIFDFFLSENVAQCRKM